MRGGRRAWRGQWLGYRASCSESWPRPETQVPGPAQQGVLEGLGSLWVPDLDFLLLWVLGQGWASVNVLTHSNWSGLLWGHTVGAQEQLTLPCLCLHLHTLFNILHKIFCKLVLFSCNIMELS